MSAPGSLNHVTARACLLLLGGAEGANTVKCTYAMAYAVVIIYFNCRPIVLLIIYTLYFIFNRERNSVTLNVWPIKNHDLPRYMNLTIG